MHGQLASGEGRFRCGFYFREAPHAASRPTAQPLDHLVRKEEG